LQALAGSNGEEIGKRGVAVIFNRDLMKVVLFCASIAASAHAAEVTLRLVCGDAPDQLVSNMVTKLDTDADAAKDKADEAEANAKNRPGAKAVAKDQQEKPKAECDQYTTYMRGIIIDGKHPFQKMYRNSFLGRSDVITLNLEDGEHTIDPGGHKFSLSGGKVTTTDATLRAKDATLDVLLFPVTMLAVDGSAIREMPAELRRLPVAMRIFHGAEELLPKEKFLSSGTTFKHLTLYMIANDKGAGYRMVPSERRFHLTEKGVVILDEANKPATDSGVLVEDRFSVVLPKAAVPVTIRGQGVRISINGPSGQFSLEAQKEKKETEKNFYAFSSPDGAEISTGVKTLTPPIKFLGDLDAFPRRKIIVDATAAESAEPRVLQAALAGFSVDVGKTMRLRAQVMDAFDAPTLAPLEIAAYLWRPAILEDDGWLKSSPSAQVPDSEWRSLRVQQASEPTADVYEIAVPDVPSNIYWLRIVAGRRGECTPRSALRADFVQGIINPAARTTLSIFCPTGRHAFLNGADLPFSVVVKSTTAVAAGKLRISLKQKDQAYPLVEQDVSALPAGSHPLHFNLQGSATSALAPGDYTLTAQIGALQSNTWSVRIASPRNKAPFPMYADGRFSEQNVDNGVTVLNVPANIAAANEARATYRRNAEILSWQYDTTLLDWYVFHPLAAFAGRDSSSEVAEVEMILRKNASLPAHEVYYYQNHFEATSEALLSQGMGQVNGVTCNLSPISLMHSVPKDVHSEMRKFQLIAQIGKKFENFDGMTLVYPNTDPMGNSEIVDPGRHARLEQLYKNFKTKYGFDPPPMSEGAKFMVAQMRGQPISPELAEAAKKWEAWTFECNSLMGDFYRQAQEAVKPLSPNCKVGNEGPGWGGSGGGTYPVTANANQSPLAVWTGFSDYGHELILEPFLRPKLLHMTGAEIWGTLFLYTGSIYNVKNHMIGHLAAGVDGFGYAGNYPLWNTGRFDTRFLPEEYKEIRSFLTTYGPMFQQVKPRGEIGILYPFHQTMYELMRINHENWKDNIGIPGAYSCMMQLALLGYDNEILTEEMISAGELKRFKVVIAPALHYLPQVHRDALEKFAAEGKPVFCGSLSTLIPKGAKKIEDDFNDVGEVNARWNLAYPRDVAHAYLFGEVQRRLGKLREELSAVLKPFARTDSTRLLVQSNRAGDARYTYVWSFLYPSWLGSTRLTSDPDASAYHAEANEHTLMPMREKVNFPADMATYDLLTQTPLDAGTAKDGRIEAACDLSFTPFKIFVSLPKPIASLRVDAPESISVGTQMPIKVAALDGDGKLINASVPLRITLLDGSGNEVRQLSGSAFPTFEAVLAAPLGFAPGNWSLRIQELISGRMAETAIAVNPAKGLPFGDAVTQIPKVDVQRPDLVQGFLEARKKDGEPVWILLNESQLTKRQALAQDAVKQFQALGIKAEIKSTNAPGVYSKEERLHLWEGWTEMAPAQYIERHIVLLGGEGENVLLEEIQSAQLLTRSLTASYPGAGKGVLTIVRSPFAFGRDVLCLLGPDDEGVHAAIAELAKLSTRPQGKLAAEQPKLVTQKKDGVLKAGTPFMDMDGAPVQTITANVSTGRIAFGTLGYAKNIFVFDMMGKPVFEDKIGHINTLGLQLLSDGQRAMVSSDGTLYLREADGTLRWRLPFERGWNEHDYADPEGRYIVTSNDGRLSIFDFALKPLWSLDEWNKYETNSEILQSRKATFLAALDGGKLIAYRLTGRAPGLTGTFGDDVIICDALSGKEQRRIPLDMAAIDAYADMKSPELKEFSLHHNGTMGLVILQTRDDRREILLNESMKPVAKRQFTLPPYMAAKAEASNLHLLSDKRLIATVGDTLCISNTDWTQAATLRLDEIIIGFAVDEGSKRIGISTNSGRIFAYDFELKKLWERDLGSGAMLYFLPSGQLAAGTMRGQANLLDSSGKVLWTQSLNRFSPPEDIERRWTELESLPTIGGSSEDAWWERLAENIPLAPAMASLEGRVETGKPLTATFAGAPYGTYLVEWRHGKATDACSLTLDIDENEKAPDAAKRAAINRLSRSAKPQEKEFVERAILRLGDQPEKVMVTIQASGAGSATSAVSIRALQFPSEDLVRIPALYRDMKNIAAYVNPSATVEMFFNPDFGGSGIFTANWAEPMCLINGRMLENEPQLLAGKWFGGNNSAYSGTNKALMPCYVDITMPKKRFVSHVVIAETPQLGRVSTLTIDAFVESRETRKGLSDFENRQVKRGYWQNAVKRRGNSHYYNVYKLPKTIYTNKLRVYLLDGFSSIDEIEVYETIPEQLRPQAKKEGDEKTHAPAK
jgi:hypothetical protein